jgi:thiamine-phosphate pyrophosphorylase
MQSIEGLHVLISEQSAKPHSLLDMARMSIDGGASVIQLRDKETDDATFLRFGQQLLEYIGGSVPLIINDRVPLAKVIGAQGVHVGQKDMPAREARKLIGSHMILGVSAASVKEAVQAEKDGADYIGVGPIFPTVSKEDADPPIGVQGLEEIFSAVSIPIIAIGGLTIQNASEVRELSAGVAVIGAVLKASDPQYATEQLVHLLHPHRNLP